MDKWKLANLWIRKAHKIYSLPSTPYPLPPTPYPYPLPSKKDANIYR